MNDQTLLHALTRSGDDHEAFAPFYRHYFRPILSYIGRRVQDPEVTLDLTSETFAQAFLHRRRFRGNSLAQAEAWIYKIAERQVSRFFRKGRAEMRAMSRLEIERPALDAARRDAIEELSDIEGLRGVLRAGLSQISPVQLEAVGLRVLEGFSYEEIADHLQITELAARARVSRALRTLATSMQNDPTIKEMS